MHGPIPVGIATKLGIGIAVLGILPPLLTEVVAAIENTGAGLGGAGEASAIIGTVGAVAVILIRGAQAVAAIIKGK